MRSLLESVVRGAELLAARSGSLALTDTELVQRLLQDRDQSVFLLLVRRHAPLVWGVCRQMLPNDQDAEDAFQATFLALVRSLDKVRKQQSLGPWLHGVAYRIAMKIRREAARRKQREARIRLEERSQPVADSTWNRLQGIVHEEIASLPDPLREAFVLCCLEGRSQHEAAEQLGWKLGTLSARVTQARQRLLDRLTRRDIALSTAAAMVASNLTSGGPALALSNSTVSLFSARIESIPTTISTLAQGVVPMMWTRTKLAVLGIVFGGLVTTGIGWMATSEAQTPAIQAEIENYLTALREEKTEYRFVQVVKPLTIDEMRKVLATSEREGWTYCGTQELITKESKPLPHMVFKRGKTSIAQEQEKHAVEIAKQQELVARVQGVVQERMRQDERERAVAAQAAHEQTRQRALNDSIETSNKRILEAKALLDAATKAGNKAEIERLSSQMKTIEDLKKKLEATLAQEEAERRKKQVEPAEVEKWMKDLREAETKIEKLRTIKDALFAKGITAEDKKIDQEIAAQESVIKILRSQIDMAKKQAVDLSLQKSEIADDEGRIARMKAEIEKLDTDLKPLHVEKLKESLDWGLSAKKKDDAIALSRQMEEEKRLDAAKRLAILKDRIQLSEAERQKLSDVQHRMKREANEVEEAILSARKQVDVYTTSGNKAELDKWTSQLRGLQSSKEEISKQHEDLVRKVKELDMVREAFLREATQSEIDSIRTSRTERATPSAPEASKNAVLKTYSFSPTLPWKHAAEVIRVFENEKGTVAIKKEGDQYSLIAKASAAAHEKVVEYIKKNNVSILIKP